MKKPLITSVSNPLIKQVRALRQKKARRESGLFLVEGIHHVGEVVQAGWELESVLYAPDTLTSSFAHDLISRLNFAPQPVTPQVMESLADKDNPQGIIAIVHQRQTQITSVQPSGNAVALVSAQDPGNVGTILRTMDAVGVDTLFMLDGGVELYHPSVVRASMGALSSARMAFLLKCFPSSIIIPLTKPMRMPAGNLARRTGRASRPSANSPSWK
jgi:TrmH family RNA methyltransferase